MPPSLASVSSPLSPRPTPALPPETEVIDSECVMSVLKTGLGLGLGLDSQKPSSPYVHPLLRRSSFMMSQRSLEICTENLGSETGSDDFDAEDERLFSPSSPEEEEVKKELRSTNLGSQPPRWFPPPPIPSISRGDGPCLHMRPHRGDGRLIIEAVPIPSHNHLLARRHNGHLLLAFVDSS